jgi:hypothetical protein
VLGNGVDADGNGIPDDVENEIRENNGLGPNEPISKEQLQDFIESKKVDAQMALATTWKPTDITAMTGIGGQVLSASMNAIFNYLGQSAKADADVKKAEIMKQAYMNGKVGYSVAPVGIGNLVKKDKSKIGPARYLANDGKSYIDFKKIEDGKIASAFDWKTPSSNNPTSGGYSVVLNEKAGGYIQFAYLTNNSMFNGLYTTNVQRCCYHNNSPNKWDGPVDGSAQKIDNYIITEVRLTGKTSSTTINETYSLENVNAQCAKTTCQKK